MKPRYFLKIGTDGDLTRVTEYWISDLAIHKSHNGRFWINSPFWFNGNLCANGTSGLFWVDDIILLERIDIE